MSSTMLQLGQDIMAELGLSTPNSIANNLDPNVTQLLAIMNSAGSSLLHIPEEGWEYLITEYRFFTSYLTTTGNVTDGSAVVTNIPSTSGLVANTWMAVGTGINQDTFIQSVDSSTQVTLTQPCSATSTGVEINFSQTKYSLPADYDYQISRTHWDKSQHWEMLGNESAQQWQWLKSGYISTGPRVRYRQLGGYFQIWPPLSSSEYLGFEYASTYWARDGSGTPISRFSSDTDTCVYPDRLIISMSKMKYWQAKGIDATALQNDYAIELQSALARDRAAPNLSFAPRPSEVLISWDNIPDSNYGNP